ncbi:unnamed protein product, partial [Staurois parvus]
RCHRWPQLSITGSRTEIPCWHPACINNTDLSPVSSCLCMLHSIKLLCRAICMALHSRAEHTNTHTAHCKHTHVTL